LHEFASGWKRNYYGKGDVIVYRLNRDGAPPAVFGANVTMLLYGDAFWPTYTAGDNTGLVATDSMKNFIQRESLNFTGRDLESYCRFLAEKFLATYPQTGGVQVRAEEIPYQGETTYVPAGPERAAASVELTADGIADVRSGIRGFKLLRLGGSAFYGFVRDQYTTLPEIHNRPLHMWLDLEWLYGRPEAAFQCGKITGQVREVVMAVFRGFESGSIQQVIYQIGSQLLNDISDISEVRLEANNRTWDTIVEHGDKVGVYTDARPPYGILGLTLKR
jgi:urate oxidase